MSAGFVTSRFDAQLICLNVSLRWCDVGCGQLLIIVLIQAQAQFKPFILIQFKPFMLRSVGLETIMCNQASGRCSEAAEGHLVDER